MGRPTKQGIDYFALDTNFDDDLNLFLAETQAEGLGILISTWQLIYSNYGYFAYFDSKLPLKIKQRCYADIDRIKTVLIQAVNAGIFDKTLFDTKNILTSRGIQRRYFVAARHKKVIEINPDFMLIDVSTVKNIVSNVGNPHNYGRNATKEKEKEKEKEKTGARAPLNRKKEGQARAPDGTVTSTGTSNNAGSASAGLRARQQNRQEQETIKNSKKPPVKNDGKIKGKNLTNATNTLLAANKIKGKNKGKREPETEKEADMKTKLNLKPRPEVLQLIDHFVKMAGSEPVKAYYELHHVLVELDRIDIRVGRRFGEGHPDKKLVSEAMQRIRAEHKAVFDEYEQKQRQRVNDTIRELTTKFSADWEKDTKHATV